MTAQRALWIVLAVAALLRAAYLADVLRHPLLADFVILDSEVYETAAIRIVDGDWLLGDEPFGFGPLYFYFLALVRALFGDSHVVVYVIQLGMGLASTAIAAWIARRCFDAWAGVATAGLMALYGAFAHMELKLMSTALAVLLSVGSLALALRARDEGWRAGWLVPGVLIGLTCLARPNTILFAPVFAAWLLWDRRQLVPVAFLTAGVLLGVIPATARNLAVTGEFTLISSQGGIVFAQAYNPDSRGTYTPVAPEFSGDPRAQAAEQKRIAELRTGRSMTVAEASEYWFSEGLRFIVENPGDTLLLELRKLGRWLASEELSGEYVLDLEREITPTLKWMPLPFGVLLGLGWLGVRSRRPDAALWLVYLFVLVNAATAVLFYFSSRYRLPSVPLVAVVAGGGLAEAVRRVRTRRAGLAAWLAPALVIAALSSYTWTDDAYFQGATEYYNLGNEFKERGLYEQAIEHYEKSLARREDVWSVHLNLANALYHAGRYAESASHCERVLELNPNWEQRDTVEALLTRLRKLAR